MVKETEKLTKKPTIHIYPNQPGSHTVE